MYQAPYPEPDDLLKMMGEAAKYGSLNLCTSETDKGLTMDERS